MNEKSPALGLENSPAVHWYAILDAVRSYERIALARRLCPEHACLFEEPMASELDDVAPHVFRCDDFGAVAALTVAKDEPGEFGVLLESVRDFASLRDSARRRLSVIRERDQKRVLFRFYDPRIMRVFLPACHAADLQDFLNPFQAVHCQAEEPGTVVSFRMERERLVISETEVEEFLELHFGSV